MMQEKTKRNIAIGLSTFIIVIFAVGGLVISRYFAYPQYHLGMKDEMLSDLTEYFAREPQYAVRIGQENMTPATDAQTYRYELIADSDELAHGNLTINTFSDDRVWGLAISWTWNNTNLKESGDILASGLADLTILDWQGEDGQPNRNVAMLEWIDGNNAYSIPYLKDDLKERRQLSHVREPQSFFIDVSIEP